jgi:hypothetical protein
MVDDLPAAIHGGGLGRGCTVGKSVVGFRHEPTNLAACYMGGTALMLPCSLGSEERANLELEPASSMGTFPLPLTNSMTFRRSEAKQEPIRHVLDTSHYSARSTPCPPPAPMLLQVQPEQSERVDLEQLVPYVALDADGTASSETPGCAICLRAGTA